MGLKRYFDLQNWYSNHVLLFLVREPEEIQLPTLASGHVVSIVTEQNIADTQRFERKEYTAVYKRMLKHGDVGYFGYIDGKCACRLWGMVSPDEKRLYGIKLNPKGKEILVHYVETAADSRRKGIARECLTYLVHHFQGKEMCVFISIDNTASLRLHKKLGFTEKAILTVKKRKMQEFIDVHWL